MKQLDFVKALRVLDDMGRYVFTKTELRNGVFASESKASFERRPTQSASVPMAL